MESEPKVDVEELISFKKKTLKYFYYSKKPNLTLKQKDFIIKYKAYINKLLKEN
jgi:hypothetical protein